MSTTDTDLYTDEDELSIVDFDFGVDPPLRAYYNHLDFTSWKKQKLSKLIKLKM